jgi:hypothetical protein
MSNLKVLSKFKLQRLKFSVYLLTNHQTDGDTSTFTISRDQPPLPVKVHE